MRRALAVLLAVAMLVGAGARLPRRHRIAATGMPAEVGPLGVLVPAGACAAAVGGHVWVLPCSAPLVVASRRRSVGHRWRAAGIGGTALALALAAWWGFRRRR